MDAPTDRAKLVEAALVPHVAENSLHAYLRRHRVAGLSWRAIANDVSHMSGIAVTDVTVASWYPDLRESLSAADAAETPHDPGSGPQTRT